MNILFEPESEQFVEVAKEYSELWEREGRRIVATMNELTGLPEPKDFTVIVFEGISFSGDETRPMRLRASYSSTVKLGTLIHELGHRYIIPIELQDEDFDVHRLLYLVLYDLWVDLYGTDFADTMVRVESERKGRNGYSYKSAWDDTLAMSRAERVANFNTIRTSH